jgi:hypothetical protein
MKIDVSNKQGHELEWVSETPLGKQSETKALDTWQCKRCKMYWKSVRLSGPEVNRETETNLGLADIKEYLDADPCVVTEAAQ